MERLIYNSIGFLFVVSTFVMTTFSIIKSPNPQDYFIYYALIEIGSSIFFSTTGVIIVGSISSFLMIIILIITGNFLTLVAVLSYLFIIGVYLLYDKKMSDIIGNMNLEIENREEDVYFLKEEVEKNSKRIPILKNIISRYMKLSDFCIKLGSTFNIERIYRIVYDFLHTVFSESEIHIHDRKNDIYTEWVFINKMPLLIEDILKDYRFVSGENPDFKSLMAVPIYLNNEIFSVVVVKRENFEFHPSDLRFLNYITTISSVAISNSMLFEKTRELAVTDELTGLYTHSYFMERLKEEISSGFSRNTVFTFLMLDIDNFKKFNDSYGHQAGDVVLKRVGKKLKNVLRDTDIIGRYGGEEFSVILPYTEKNIGIEIAERIRKGIEREKFKFNEDEINVTATIGVSFFPEAKTYKEIVKVADDALYRGKKLGKNRVVV